MATAPNKEINEIRILFIMIFFLKYNINNYFNDTIAESYQIISL